MSKFAMFYSLVIQSTFWTRTKLHAFLSSADCLQGRPISFQESDGSEVQRLKICGFY